MIFLILYTALKNHGSHSNQDSIIVEYIIAECPNFKSFIYKLINNRSKKTFSIDFTLKKIERLKHNNSPLLSEKEIEQLKKEYLGCEAMYNELLKENLGCKNDFSSIVNKVKILSRRPFLKKF